MTLGVNKIYLIKIKLLNHDKHEVERNFSHDWKPLRPAHFTKMSINRLQARLLIRKRDDSTTVDSHNHHRQKVSLATFIKEMKEN